MTCDVMYSMRFDSPFTSSYSTHSISYSSILFSSPGHTTDPTTSLQALQQVVEERYQAMREWKEKSEQLLARIHSYEQSTTSNIQTTSPPS